MTYAGKRILVLFCKHRPRTSPPKIGNTCHHLCRCGNLFIFWRTSSSPSTSTCALISTSGKCLPNSSTSSCCAGESRPCATESGGRFSQISNKKSYKSSIESLRSPEESRPRRYVSADIFPLSVQVYHQQLTFRLKGKQDKEKEKKGICSSKLIMRMILL